MIPLPAARTTRQLTTFDRDTGVKVVFVPPRSCREIGTAEGPGVLTKLWLTFPGWFWAHWEPDRSCDQRILKHLIVRIFVDGADEPQVAAPVADLFGLGLGQMRSYAASWVGVSSGGFYLNLPMPFAASLRIEIDNRDPSMTADVFLNALYQQVDALEPGTPFLHAAFATGRQAGDEPLVLADLPGQGKYVGCTLSCQGEPLNYLAFLEAPEHVYLDGAAEPPIVGTGMEDYFLGGWYFREGAFIGPDHGVPIKDALRSSVAMYRFHDRDAIHFRRRFRLAFENPWKADRLSPFAHSSVAFLYLDRPTAVPAVPALDQLQCWYRTTDTDHQALP